MKSLIILRAYHGISQSELAERIGVSTVTVCKWESGATYPQPNNLKSISEAYDVSIDWLRAENPIAIPRAGELR